MINKYAFIVNPNAGGGKGKKLGKDLESQLKHKAINGELFYSKYIGNSIEIARDLPADFTHVIAVGGDGTINEVVNGIYDRDVIFGIIPSGTGNDFLKMVGMHTNVKEALEQLGKNIVKPVDLGFVKTENTTRYFINGLGTGFDAVAAAKANKHKGMGILAYLYAVVTTLFTYKEPNVKFEIHGEEIDIPIFLANFGNGYSAGGMFHLSPGALLDDGLFHITFISGVRKRRVPFVITKVIKGIHTLEPEVQTFTSDHGKITSQVGLSIHTDGEIIDTNAKQIEIKLLPFKMRVVFGS